jgi:hypothetical protein
MYRKLSRRMRPLPETVTVGQRWSIDDCGTKQKAGGCARADTRLFKLDHRLLHLISVLRTWPTPTRGNKGPCQGPPEPPIPQSRCITRNTKARDDDGGTGVQTCVLACRGHKRTWAADPLTFAPLSANARAERVRGVLFGHRQHALILIPN